MASVDHSELSKVFMQRLPVNNHFKEITEHFGTIRFDCAKLPPDIKFLFLCFTNRSGSNYLAELLSSSDLCGTAEEHLNSFHVIRISEEQKFTTFQQYFSYLVQKFQKNGLMTLKIAVPHLELLWRSGILDQIIGSTQFMSIERSDKLGQAISHVIAFETEKYTSWDVGKKHEMEVEYSRAEVTRVMRSIVDSNCRFELFFAMNCIAPVKVIYEQLVAEPLSQLAYVAYRLGWRKGEVVLPKVRLQKQASDLNEQWRERYVTGTDYST